MHGNILSRVCSSARNNEERKGLLHKGKIFWDSLIHNPVRLFFFCIKAQCSLMFEKSAVNKRKNGHDFVLSCHEKRVTIVTIQRGLRRETISIVLNRSRIHI